MLSTRVLGFKQQTSGEKQQGRPPRRVLGKPSFGIGRTMGAEQVEPAQDQWSAPTPQQKGSDFPAMHATWLCTGGGKINVCGRRGPTSNTLTVEVCTHRGRHNSQDQGKNGRRERRREKAKERGEEENTERYQNGQNRNNDNSKC